MARFVHAAAPVRIDFTGGFTDVEPFCTDHPAIHVNAAIELEVHTTIQARDDQTALVYCGESDPIQFDILGEQPPAGAARIVHAAASVFRLNHGLNIWTTSAAPTGAGLGSSGAFTVTIIGALNLMAGVAEQDLIVTAESAAKLERKAGVAGGRQDQYAACLGCVHRLEFRRDTCSVRELALIPDGIERLEQSTIIAYRGGKRLSHDLVRPVMDAYRARDPKVTDALHALNALADPIASALEDHDVDSLCRLFRRVRSHQAQLHPDILDSTSNRQLMTLEHATTAGAKLLGGGGAGACVLVAFPAVERQAVIDLLEKEFTLIPVRIARSGLCVRER